MRKSLSQYFIVLFLMIAAIILYGCGNGASNNLSGWDHFESINRIGDSYYSISEDYDSLSDAGVFDGGVALEASKDLYFSFPAWSKEDINDDDLCTGMYGTLKSFFDINEERSVDELKEILTITVLDDNYDGSVLFRKSSTSGSYYVRIYSEKSVLDPKTAVSVIQYEDTRYDEGAMPKEDVSVEMHRVDSSAISRIGYDANNKVLGVEFEESGDVYYYYDVPENVYNDLKKADSIGGYYNDYIKGEYYSVKQ